MTRSQKPTGAVSICLQLCSTVTQHIPKLWTGSEDLLRKAIAKDKQAGNNKCCQVVLKFLNKRYYDIKNIVDPINNATVHILDRASVPYQSNVPLQPDLELPPNYNNMHWCPQSLSLQETARETSTLAGWTPESFAHLAKMMESISSFYRVAAHMLSKEESILEHKQRLEANCLDTVTDEEWRTWNEVVKKQIEVLLSADDTLKDLCRTTNCQTILDSIPTQTNKISAVQKRTLFPTNEKARRTKVKSLDTTDPQGTVALAVAAEVSPTSVAGTVVTMSEDSIDGDAVQQTTSDEKPLAGGKNKGGTNEIAGRIIPKSVDTTAPQGTVPAAVAAEVSPTSVAGTGVTMSEDTIDGVVVEQTTSGEPTQAGGKKKRGCKCKTIEALCPNSIYFKCPATGCEKVSIWSFKDEDREIALQQGMLLLPPDEKNRQQINDTAHQRTVKCLPKPGYTGMKEHLRTCKKFAALLGPRALPAGQDAKKPKIPDNLLPPLYRDRRVVKKKNGLHKLSRAEKKQRENEKQKVDRRLSKRLVDKVTGYWDNEVEEFFYRKFGLTKKDIPRNGFAFADENDYSSDSEEDYGLPKLEEEEKTPDEAGNPNNRI